MAPLYTSFMSLSAIHSMRFNCDGFARKQLSNCVVIAQSCRPGDGARSIGMVVRFLPHVATESGLRCLIQRMNARLQHLAEAWFRNGPELIAVTSSHIQGQQEIRNRAACFVVESPVRNWREKCARVSAAAEGPRDASVFSTRMFKCDHRLMVRSAKCIVFPVSSGICVAI